MCVAKRGCSLAAQQCSHEGLLGRLIRLLGEAVVPDLMGERTRNPPALVGSVCVNDDLAAANDPDQRLLIDK